MMAQGSALLAELQPAIKKRRSRKYVVGPNQSAKAILSKAVDWTPEQVRGIAAQITSQIVRQQIQRGNKPEEMRVDGTTNRPVDRMRNNIVVLFAGGLDARPVMRDMMTAAANALPTAVTWHWIVRSGPRQALIQDMIRSGQPVRLQFGDVLYLVPRGEESNVPLDNILAKHGLRRLNANKWTRVGKARAGKAPIGTAAGIIRRRAKPQFHVTAHNSFMRAAEIGRVTGPRPPRISPFTGRTSFWQGVWFFRLTRSIR